jgi:hypothetical protein
MANTLKLKGIYQMEKYGRRDREPSIYKASRPIINCYEL